MSETRNEEKRQKEEEEEGEEERKKNTRKTKRWVLILNVAIAKYVLGVLCFESSRVESWAEYVLCCFVPLREEIITQ